MKDKKGRDMATRRRPHEEIREISRHTRELLIHPLRYTEALIQRRGAENTEGRRVGEL